MTHINLERLHRLVTEGKTERGQGSTTLACDTLINQVLIGNIKTFVAVVTRFRDIWYIAPMLSDMGLPIEKYDRSCQITTTCGCRILFVTRLYLEQHTRGIDDYLIVEFDDYEL